MTQNDAKDKILEELTRADTMLLHTAYLYAKNFIQYGVDVTCVWDTATKQSFALEKAYMDGYKAAVDEVVKGYAEVKADEA